MRHDDYRDRKLSRLSGRRNRPGADGRPEKTVEEIQEVKDGRIRVKRHIDGGVETVEAPLDRKSTRLNSSHRT